MDRRLLHPGAETKNIIEFYIYAIKYLRIMDPLGVMLDRTARQINKYLRFVFTLTLNITEAAILEQV
jgi:hypothetical protein